MTNKLTVSLAVRESEEVVKRLDEIAHERGSTRSDIVREYLRTRLKEDSTNE